MSGPVMWKLTAAGELPLPAGRFVKVTIADHGAGVPEEEVTKIFDPYFTTKPTASGLGLAISYSIVKRHGGLLHLETTSPDGSTFAFYLPAVARTRLVKCEPDGDDRVRKSELPRILVMDDELGDSRIDLAIARHPWLRSDSGGRWAGSNQILRAGFASRENLPGGHPGCNQSAAVWVGSRRSSGCADWIQRSMPSFAAGIRTKRRSPNFLSYGFRGALPKPFTRDELADALQRTLIASLTKATSSSAVSRARR